jgi:hypothetical protein
MNFRKASGALVAAGLVLALSANARAAGEEKTVAGYVLDSACAFVKNLKKPVSRECAVACAKAGSPLVILGLGGAIYWPIDAAVPAHGQNPLLMKYAGESVKVTGKVWERGGSYAIQIEKIERVRIEPLPGKN